jgi:hypothetical protein
LIRKTFRGPESQRDFSAPPVPYPYDVPNRSAHHMLSRMSG